MRPEPTPSTSAAAYGPPKSKPKPKTVLKPARLKVSTLEPAVSQRRPAAAAPTHVPEISQCPPNHRQSIVVDKTATVKYPGKRPNRYSSAGEKLAAAEKKAAKKNGGGRKVVKKTVTAKKRRFPKENSKIPTLAKAKGRGPKARKMTTGEKRKRSPRDEGKKPRKHVRFNTW